MTTPFPFVANAILTAAQLNAVTTLPISAKTASATLVVGDVGYRVQMTAAGSTTITVNTGIFAAGDTIWIQNMGAGTCTITAGTATVGTASSLALAQYGGGTLVFQSASAATFFSQQAASYGTATGLTGALATPPAGYSGLYATSDGTLTVTKAGLFDVLMFAGGSSGGYQTNTTGVGASGGGGAGGKVAATVYLDATTYAITVGAGGTASSSLLGNGLKTSLGSVLVAAGGGVGYGDQDTERYQASQGGCGGGGGRVYITGGKGIQGFAGGNGTYPTDSNSGGGGGVAAVGANGSGTTAGAGGAGFDIATFTGNASTFKGGGGGGGASVTAGAGGSSVGGAGSTSGVGNNAAANTASGGGGTRGTPGTGGSGGSGVFYIRFKA